MRAIALLVVFALASGCASGGSGKHPPSISSSLRDPPASAQDPPNASSNAPPSEPVTTQVPLSFEGELPNSAYVCAPNVGCNGTETGPYKDQIKVEKLTGNLTALHLTMTWSATSPTMQTMALEAMVMYPRSCAECKSVLFAKARGPSPLKLDGAPDLRQAIAPPGVLHVYFYALDTGAGGAGFEVDAQTRVKVEGSAQLLSP